MIRQSGKLISPTKLLEKQVTQQVKDFMQLRGWRPIRMQRTVVPGQFQSGEPGQPDFLFVRYLDCKLRCASLCLWIEMKAPTGKIGPHQLKWHYNERHRGGTVWVVDEFAAFERLYQATFGWLHSGDTAIGQLDLLAGLK